MKTNAYIKLSNSVAENEIYPSYIHIYNKNTNAYTEYDSNNIVHSPDGNDEYIIHIPSENGTLAVTSDIPTDASVAAWGYIKTITDASIAALGYTKNTGTLTGVKFNGTDASITNGVAAITANIPIEVIEIIGDPDSITSVPAGTFARCGELVDENKSIILRFKYYANSNEAVDYI